MSSRLFSLALSGALLLGQPLSAAVYDVTIDGSDAIFLAGRTDLVIPDPSQPWGDNNAATDDGMLRHSGTTPEEIKETLPPVISVAGGDVVRVVDPAIGGISFFNGVGAPYYGPEGNLAQSQVTSFGGISGYNGTQGALVGVFLDDSIPTGTAPATLDFWSGTPGKEFLSIAPELGQIFFIGNGQTSGGIFQQFAAPTGATRLFLGIPDGFGFNGVPGAYDDNDGAYRIRVGINQIPTVPLPAAGWLLLGGLGGLAALRRRTRG